MTTKELKTAITALLDAQGDTPLTASDITALADQLSAQGFADNLETVKEQRERCALPHSTLVNLIERGEFPKPIKLSSSGRRVAGRVLEAEVWRAYRMRVSRSAA